MAAPASPGLASILSSSQSGGAAALNPDRPDTYVVQKGDTLWDISGTFLRDPWYWPEIWEINPQVANPHLIYPGDILSLVYVDGKPRIRLQRGNASAGAPAGADVVSSGNTERLSPQVREEDLGTAIPTIAYQDIAALLNRGKVFEKNEYENLGYIVALRDHLVSGSGNDVYVRGAEFADNEQFGIAEIGDPIRDPDDNKVVGYEGTYVGFGTIELEGDPATMMLNETTREARQGQRVFPLNIDVPLNFYPRAPEEEVEGRIIHVMDGVSRVGQYQTVVINRGTQHGVDAGHVFSIWQLGEVVKDRWKSGFGSRNVALPDVQAGTLMVVKTYDRVSYALVMEATSEIRVKDRISNPE
ncbi:MAG: LysM peptidoglycan-binding domain-containing protein [Gammaproteobacteria bacterium]